MATATTGRVEVNWGNIGDLLVVTGMLASLAVGAVIPWIYWTERGQQFGAQNGIRPYCAEIAAPFDTNEELGACVAAIATWESKVKSDIEKARREPTLREARRIREAFVNLDARRVASGL